MKFHPPIKERETDDLIAIANFSDMWQPDAVEQAIVELDRRCISAQEQEKKVEKWNRDYQAELKCEIRKRALVKYHPIQLIIMALYFPFTLLSGWNLIREGYIKLHKQRLWAIVIGFACYLCSMLYVIYNSAAVEEATLKLIQEQDISEWEKSYYGTDSMETDSVPS